MIISGTLLRGGRAVEGWIEARGEVIARVGTGPPPRRRLVRAEIVAPGLVDLQVNGAGGRSVNEGVDALRSIDSILLARGVTGYLATIISSPMDEAAHAIDAIARCARDSTSPVEGAHLEGPFISPEFRGVHPAESLRRPGRSIPEYFRSPAVRLVTVAPELPGGLELIAFLRSRGVRVSIGHSGASADQAAAAVVAGATMVTHLFNAMRPFGHHCPNLPGWALATNRISLGVIADGHHVHPLVLEVISRAAGDRVVLVTDSTPAAAAPPGHYRMGTVDVSASEGFAVDGRGKLAGSVLTLDEAVRRWARFTHQSLPKAWFAASERPARALGIRNGLREGFPANLVLLSGNGVVQRVMRRGEWVT